MRTVLTVDGRIETCRTRWHEAGAGSDTPVDRLLDATQAVVSVGVRELCCRLGTAGGSFARAAANLERAAGVKLSGETLRQVTQREGRAALAAAGAAGQLEPDFCAADCLTTRPDDGREVSRLYVSCDGVLTPRVTRAEKRKRRAATLRKRRRTPAPEGRRRRPLSAVKKGADQRYKQVYLTTFYDQGQTRRLVGVTREDHRGLGRLLAREAARVRLRGADERLGLIDGASCLRKRMGRLPLTALALDFFHLSSHVHQGRVATFGEGDAAGNRWTAQLLHAVKHEGYEAFWGALCAWRARQRGGKRKAADALLNYVAQRREMIAYDEARRAGRHIASGPMESMCKATTRRIKGCGMRWDGDNAESMMALEAMYQSNLWEKYWANALMHLN